MRHLRIVITGCVVVALCAGARPGLGGEREGLEAVKDLYESAAYDEALSTLDHIDRDTLRNSSVAQVARQYRALCLIALDRSIDAERTLEDMVRADPAQSAPAEFPPRLAAMFRRIRERLLPELALEQYTAAKLSFDRQEYAAASAGFDRLTALLADSALTVATNTTLRDMKTLASGFQQLAKASIQPAPTPPVNESAQGGGLPSDGDTANGAVIGAVAVRQQFPAWPSEIAIRPGTTYTGVVEVTITPAGDVASLKFIKRVHPVYDHLIETAAKGWKYRPATRNGEPVAFMKLVNIEITDSPRR
jgi:hypothetical protein